MVLDRTFFAGKLKEAMLYQKQQDGRVFDSLKLMKSLGIWLEITTVIIPGINDDTEELRDIARFIVWELGVDTPWHITRFFPAYKMENIPPTPLVTLYQAREIGLEEGLQYIYFGNFLGQGNQDTICHKCGKVLIQRRGFELVENFMQSQQCVSCGTLIPGVGLSHQVAKNLT